MGYQETEAFKTLLPILFGMKIFGAVHTKYKDTVQNVDQSKKVRFKLTVSQCYSIFVTVVACVMAVVNMVVHKVPVKYGVDLFSKISAIMIYFEVISQLLSFHVASGVLPKFFEDFSHLYQRYRKNKHLNPNLKVLVKISLSISVIGSVLSSCTVAYKLFTGQPIQTEASYSLDSTTLDMLSRIFTVILAIYKVDIFFFTAFFVILVCK